MGFNTMTDLEGKVQNPSVGEAMKEAVNKSVGGKANHATETLDFDNNPTFDKTPGAYSGGLNMLTKVGIKNIMSTLGTGGEHVDGLFKYTQDMFESFKTNNNDMNFRVFRILKDHIDEQYSSVVLTLTKGGSIFFHVLMLEATGEYPAPYVDSQARIEIRRTPGQVLSSRYYKKVREAISIATRIPINQVHSAFGVLVTNDFTVADVKRMEAIVTNGLNAIITETTIVVDKYAGASIQSMLSEHEGMESRFVIQPEFNKDRTQCFDQTGMPVHQDVCVILKIISEPIKQNNHPSMISLEYEDSNLKVTEVSRTYGYIDFQWQAPQVINGITSNRCFLPNFVVNHMSSNEYTLAPHLLIMNLVKLYSISHDMSWVEAFTTHNPVPKGEIDPKNIGNLNIEGGLGAQANTRFGVPVDVTAPEFTTEVLLNFIDKLVIPKLMLISIDVPIAGPDTWFLSIFSYIARNNKRAIDRLERAMRTLLGGDVTYKASEKPMFFNLANVVGTGYYRSKTRKTEIEDLRAVVNYLGVAGYVASTGSAPSLLREYTNTMQDRSLSAVHRCVMREPIVMKLTNNTAVFKGTAERFIVNGGWLEDEGSKLAAVGFSPKVHSDRRATDVFAVNGTDLAGAAVGQGFTLTKQTMHNGFSGWGYDANNYKQDW